MPVRKGQIEQVCSCVVVMIVTTADNLWPAMATTQRNTPAVFSIFNADKGWGRGTAGVEVHTGREKERKRKPMTGLSERKTGVEGNYNKTLTQREVKQLERHLSMKRTVRKKGDVI